MASNFIDIIVRVLGSSASKSAIDNTAKALDHLGKEAEQTAASASKIGKDLSGIAGLEAKTQRLAGAMDRARAETQHLGAALDKTKQWGAGMAIAGGAGIMLSAAFAKAANDVVESENLIKESFGNNLQAIIQWSDGLQSTLKLNGVEVRKAAAVFNVMFESMGLTSGEALDMSKSLTMLAHDMASFYNLSPEEAFIKLKAGITGESEPLKALGILVNETTVKNKALEMGIVGVGDALTEQQKVQARYALIMESTSKAQGDLARTMDSGANKARAFGTQVQLATVAVGAGSAKAQEHVQGLGGAMLSLVNVIPGLAPAGGYLFTISSYALTAAGSLLALFAQAGQAVLGLSAYKTMKSTTAAATVLFATAEWDAAFAAAANATAQTGAAVATAGVGNASIVAAGKVGIFAAMSLAAKLGFAGLVAVATFGLVLIIEKLGKMLGLVDKNASALDDMKRGWADLTGDDAYRGREMRDKDLQGMKKHAADMRTAGKSEAEIEDFTRKRTAEIETHWAKQFGENGLNPEYVTSSEALGAVKKQDEMQAELASMTSASLPAIAPSAALAGGVAATGAMSGPGLPMPAAMSSAMPADAFASGQLARPFDPFAPTRSQALRFAGRAMGFAGMGNMSVNGTERLVKATPRSKRDITGGIRISFDDVFMPSGGLDGALGRA